MTSSKKYCKIKYHSIKKILSNSKKTTIWYSSMSLGKLKPLGVAPDAIFCVLKIKSKLIYVSSLFYDKINLESLRIFKMFFMFCSFFFFFTKCLMDILGGNFSFNESMQQHKRDMRDLESTAWKSPTHRKQNGNLSCNYLTLNLEKNCRSWWLTLWIPAFPGGLLAGKVLKTCFSRGDVGDVVLPVLPLCTECMVFSLQGFQNILVVSILAPYRSFCSVNCSLMLL